MTTSNPVVTHLSISNLGDGVRLDLAITLGSIAKALAFVGRIQAELDCGPIVTATQTASTAQVPASTPPPAPSTPGASSTLPASVPDQSQAPLRRETKTSTTPPVTTVLASNPAPTAPVTGAIVQAPAAAPVAGAPATFNGMPIPAEMLGPDTTLKQVFTWMYNDLGLHDLEQMKAACAALANVIPPLTRAGAQVNDRLALAHARNLART